MKSGGGSHYVASDNHAERDDDDCEAATPTEEIICCLLSEYRTPWRSVCGCIPVLYHEGGAKGVLGLSRIGRVVYRPLRQPGFSLFCLG